MPRTTPITHSVTVRRAGEQYDGFTAPSTQVHLRLTPSAGPFINNRLEPDEARDLAAWLLDAAAEVDRIRASDA
jgi:hypothetical protein